MRKLLFTVLFVGFLSAALFSFGGCSSPVPNRNPIGEVFPTIEATPLDAEGEGSGEVRIPGDFAGAPLLLLVGYVQDAQFDIDRWLFGVLDAELGVALREVPAARGMAASLASGFIDSGMRKGIPQTEWGAVVTTYGKTADTIAKVTGTERPRNARVLLLDGEGVIRWFHDAGFSAATLIALRSALAELR
ncbi:hypothetical protein [Saltatorellus ferox]